MPSPLSGPGLGLPLPQNLYPSELNNAPLDTPTNRVALAPGDAMQLPAGDFYISTGQYCGISFLDPVTNLWSRGTAASYSPGMQYVKSDGFNVRVENMTGCIVGLDVTSLGSGYAQATTTISFTGATGYSAVPLVGGALALSGGTLTSNGAGFGVPPLVFIPAPPPAANNANGVGGIPASGYCILASGTVSGFSFTHQGAGYPVAPPVVVVPSPFDPNINAGITTATITFTLAQAGALTGAFVTQIGAALNNNSLASVTVTVSGAGTGGTVTPLILQTVVAGSIVGAGIGAAGASAAKLTTVGGVPAVGSIAASPDGLGLAWRPRPADIGLTTTTGTITAQVGSIYDGGLFLASGTTGPTPVVIPTNILSAYPTVSIIMGSRPDTVVIQPAP